MKKKYFLLIFLFFFQYAFVLKYLFNKYDFLLNVNKETNYLKFNITKYINTKVNKRISNPKIYLDTDFYNEEYKTKNTFKLVKNIKPKIYIYNTHQTESYKNYNVYDASKLLSDNLNNKGYKNIFEEQSVPAFLNSNHMKYYESYKVSRKYMLDAKNKHKDLVYFFDIHRDALSKEKSTINIENKNYAKILFVIGKENKDYEKNLENAKKLNKIIEKNKKGISRGIILKEGKGVNGLYNQDISENTFLIEIGGNYNTKEEVLNTLNVIEKSIINYIGDIYD